MPIPLVTQHYPDDFQIFTFPLLVGSGYRSEEAGAVTTTPLLYEDRDLVVDSITVAISVVGTSGAALNVRKSTAGTSTTPSGPSFDTTGTAVKLHTVNVDGTTLGTTVVTLNSPSTDVNLVKAGNWLGLAFAGTTANMRGMVQIRFRSRVA